MQLVEDGTAAIVKGDLCIIRAGKFKKITATGDAGPYVVAVEATAKSATGRAIIDGIVDMDEGNDGALTLGDLLIPSGTTLGDVKKATTTDYSSNNSQAVFREIRLQIGMAYEAISKDGTGRVLLGYRAGLSD